MTMLGKTGLSVSPLCIGTSPLASMPGLYGYPVPSDRAEATISAVLSSDAITFIDTSNGYGDDGSAEKRIGAALRAHGGLPPGVVLATKVDPAPGGEFSGDRVRESLMESLSRLGLDRVQLLHLHDPERMPFSVATADGGPVSVLAELKREGLAEHLGVAGGPVGLLARYLALGVFEVVLTHNRYTLLDRSAASLFRDAHARGIGVLNAAPYGGGMLAAGPEKQPRYAYSESSSAFSSAAVAMRAAAARFDVPLAAAALQFSLRASFIDSTVVGLSSPARVSSTLELASLPIPPDLWDELESLVPASSLWLDPG